MRLYRTQEMAHWIGTGQFPGAFDLFVEQPNRLHQQFRVGLSSLGV
jgi:hypothetical protein